MYGFGVNQHHDLSSFCFDRSEWYSHLRLYKEM